VEATLGELIIQFLDVGQGDGIFIKFPNRKTMLVDLGSNKNKDLVEESILKYFKEQTIFEEEGKVLDYLILTHADGDHYNLMLEFRDTLKPLIKNLLHSGKKGDYKTKERKISERKRVISELSLAQTREGKPSINVLRSSGTYPFTLETSDYFGGVSVEVLAMNVPGTTKKTKAWIKNTGSVVLKLEYAGVGVLLTGDATWDTEKYILNMMTEADRLEDLKSTILKVPHHGSARTSVSKAWIEAIKPEYVFISSDRQGASAEREKTGHRLPQQLAIDIIEKNTKLAADSLKHTYVASYDPDDYTNYKDPFTKAGFENPHTKEVPGEDVPDWTAVRCWTQAETLSGIYTTLLVMDKKFKDGTVADQGTQYAVEINREGEIEVFSVF